MTLTIKLTRSQQAAARRIAEYQRGDMPKRYKRGEEFCSYMGDVDDVLGVVLDALTKEQRDA